MNALLTPQDPACRRTLARLRAVRMAMRRAGKLATQGRPLTSAAKTDVRKTFRRIAREQERRP